MSRSGKVNRPAIDADAIRRAVESGPRLPARFYKTASVEPAGSEFSIALDNRRVKTPMKNDLSLPSRALAEAVAGEWADQRDFVDPATMPYTRLANTALDRVRPRTGEIVDEIVAYARSDLLCYRAEGPDSLVLRQTQHWDPIVGRVENEIGGRFILAQGVIHQDQPENTIAQMAARLAAYDAFLLTGIHNMTTLTGSAILAYATASGLVPGNDAWTAAHVDEDWQIERWGRDQEAQERRQARADEFRWSCDFIALARA